MDRLENVGKKASGRARKIPIPPPLERKMVKLKIGLSYSLLGGLITF